MNNIRCKASSCDVSKEWAERVNLIIEMLLIYMCYFAGKYMNSSSLISRNFLHWNEILTWEQVRSIYLFNSIDCVVCEN